MTINEMQKELMRTYNQNDLMELISEVVFDITEFVQNTNYRHEQEDSRNVWRDINNWAWEFEYEWTYNYLPNDDDYLLRLEGFVEKKLKVYDEYPNTYKVYFTEKRRGWVIVEATGEQDALDKAWESIPQINWEDKTLGVDTYKILN